MRMSILLVPDFLVRETKDPFQSILEMLTHGPNSSRGQELTLSLKEEKLLVLGWLLTKCVSVT